MSRHAAYPGGEFGREKTIYPFKIKEVLPEQKTVNITKNRQIIKAINVKRKSKILTVKTG